MSLDLIRRLCLSSPEFKEFYEAVLRGGVDIETLEKIINKYLDEHLEEIINNIAGDTITEVVNNYLEKHKISGLPEVTEADNGKMLQVVTGDWAVVDIGNIEDGEY